MQNFFIPAGIHLSLQVFIYRGHEYERLSEFNDRIMNQFPNAELMKKLEPPSDAVTESFTQRKEKNKFALSRVLIKKIPVLQINKVDPVMEVRKGKTPGSRAPEAIVRYHRVNNVSKFQYSRPHYHGASNDFSKMWLERITLHTSYPLPGILMWFPVLKQEMRMVCQIIAIFKRKEELYQFL